MRHSTNNDPSFNFVTLLGSPAKPTSPFCMAKGDNFFKAPSSVELMMRNLGQVLEVVTFVFFVYVIDSSSVEEKSPTSVWTESNKGTCCCG